MVIAVPLLVRRGWGWRIEMAIAARIIALVQAIRAAGTRVRWRILTNRRGRIPIAQLWRMLGDAGHFSDFSIPLRLRLWIVCSTVHRILFGR